MKDIRGFKSPEPELICPMRKSGGPCVEDVCAWWHENKCSVLSVSKSMYALEKVIRENRLGSGQGKPAGVIKKFMDDNDVPF